MIVELLPYESASGVETGIKHRAFSSLIQLLKDKLGVLIGYDARTLPLGDTRFIEPFRFAQQLKDCGVITHFERATMMPDEPPFYLWSATCNIPTKHNTGGASVDDEPQALTAALAESLERFIWFSQDDYFKNPIFATEEEIASHGSYIGPKQWTSFTEEQRSAVEERVLTPDAKYLWVQSTSLVTGKPVYIPAQTITGMRSLRTQHGALEPLIRNQNTIGLATWPTLKGARLAGALEVIEREAYMIMWLNRLSLPRIDLVPLCGQSESLQKLIRQCERYRLKVHAIRMLTDAPTHAICVVIEDTSGIAPKYAFGLKAHRSITYAIEKSVNEALRARRGYRAHRAKGNKWNVETPVMEIGHRDRLYFWGEHPSELEFLIRGAIEPAPTAAWDKDSIDEQYERLVEWCRESNIECVSVSLGTSKKNPTPLFVEMVALPSLIPTYLQEIDRAFGGNRLREIPEKFGYKAAKKIFDSYPHPFS